MKSIEGSKIYLRPYETERIKNYYIKLYLIRKLIRLLEILDHLQKKKSIKKITSVA